MVLDQRSPDELSRNNEEDLIKQVHESLTIDRLEDIIELFIDAVKILKHLIVPGLFKEVQTRQKYTLKVTKLDYQYIELPEQKGLYIEFYAGQKYCITSPDKQYQFMGRFNENGKADIKVPAKWAHVEHWDLTTAPIDPTFYEKYKNQIWGSALVADGVITLIIAGSFEYGTGGFATAAAVTLGVIGSEKIAAGILQITTDDQIPLLSEKLVEEMGLVPKGYEGVVVGVGELSLAGIALSIPKAGINDSIKLGVSSGKISNKLKGAQIYIKQLFTNTKQKYHSLKFKTVDEIHLGVKQLDIPQGLTEKQFSELSSLLKDKLNHISDDIFIQGSRAKGTAKNTSDIDIGVRVNKEQFDYLIKEYFGMPNVGSAKEKTMLHAIETGKIQSGEAKLRPLRKEIETMLGIEADVSIILEGGKFDTPPFIAIK